MKLVLRGPGPFKTNPDPKTMCYSSRKWPEMPEIPSFYDATRVVYRVSRALKSSRDPKTVDYSPLKQPEMLKSRVFYDFAKIV